MQKSTEYSVCTYYCVAYTDVQYKYRILYTTGSIEYDYFA